jgi:hypothetical protein
MLRETDTRTDRPFAGWLSNARARARPVRQARRSCARKGRIRNAELGGKREDNVG